MNMTATYAAIISSAVAIALVYGLLGHAGRLIEQIVAGRRIPNVFLGPWLAIAFTFSTTSLFSGATAYLYGVQGFLYYLVGNTLGLVLMIVQASKISDRRERFTYPPIMAERYDKATGALFSLAMFGIQALYILPLQFTVAAKALQQIAGIDPHTTTICAAMVMGLPVILGGMRSSSGIDFFKGLMMAGVIVFAIGALLMAGADALLGGVAHASEQYREFNVPLFVGTAGFPFFLSLVCAGPLDQSLFQRFFSVSAGKKRRMRLWLVIGVAFFAVHMIGGAVLGFLAASPSLGIHVSDASVAAYAALDHLMPTFAIVFVIGVAVAFLATGDSALNASSSVCALDMYKGWLRTRAGEFELMFVQRLCMLALVALAVFITEQGYSYFAMVTGVGAFRSALIVPAVAGMFCSKERVPRAFAGIVVGMATSVVLFWNGYPLAGSVSGIAITFAYWLYQLHVTRPRKR